MAFNERSLDDYVDVAQRIANELSYTEAGQVLAKLSGVRAFSDEFSYHDLERSALAFVLEDESWPVFLAWAAKNVNTEEAAAWIKVADLAEAREVWIEHSPDPLVRLLGGLGGLV